MHELLQLDVRKRIEQRHPKLKRSVQLKNASGRYCVDLEVDTPPPAFKKLPVISRAQFDDFLSNVVPSDQLVMVACLREDSPACRVAAQVRLNHCCVPFCPVFLLFFVVVVVVSCWRDPACLAPPRLQLLEHVNGTLSQRYPKGRGGLGSSRGGARCPYRLVKFDMASSRFLTQRYGIHSLPMFLMFLNNKLVYAGTLVRCCVGARISGVAAMLDADSGASGRSAGWSEASHATS